MRSDLRLNAAVLRRWMRRGTSVACVLVLAVVVGTGCGTSSVSLNEDPDDFREQVATLQEQIADDPSDGEALRDLGAIYMRTDRPARAYDTLKKAFDRDPTDPKTLFFLGLASEGVGKRRAALKLFQRYDRVPEDSRYRDLMEGRYTYLLRQETRRQVRELIANEEKVADRRLSENTLAVIPLDYRGSDDTYAPLGRGLAEMILTDLTNVRDLRLVERVRLQAILDELELAQSEYVDPSTAPRVGKLLGAGRIVGGSYLVTSDERVRLDLTIADATGGRSGDVDTQIGSLRDLFRLQTEVVYQVVRALGIELTPQERQSIEPVPTENLQAFLAYSRGLLEEDRGNYGAAAAEYREAVRLDPGFSQPQQRQRKANGLSATAGSRENALSSAIQATAQTTPEISLINERLSKMGLGEVAPRPERDPAQEAGGADEQILADPPAPPSTSGGGNQP